MLGKPYNYSYILNENEYYCCDFIESSFQDCKIFKLEPMTFKNTSTGGFGDFWIEYYKKLNLPIPEGKLGCNSNGISKSENIYKIGILK